MSTTLTAVTDAARHADDAATSVAALAALARRLGLTYAPTSARWLAEVNRAMVEAERAEEAARAARFALRRIADRLTD